MEKIRKPFQGVLNIIQFNWHFYAISILIIWLITIFNFNQIIIYSIAFPIIMSLLISFYIYDLSNLYSLKWLGKLDIKSGEIVNIHAGFDETSVLIQNKYPKEKLRIFDFYDQKLHTEISIKRARKKYKPNKKTVTITTKKIPLEDKTIQTIFLLFSAHEIRNQKERTVFFKELNRVLTTNGNVILTEHLRDLPNFIAYNIGFFHFLSKRTWLNTFEKSNFKIEKQIKITPFITTYKLSKNGTTS